MGIEGRNSSGPQIPDGEKPLEVIQDIWKQEVDPELLARVKDELFEKIEQASGSQPPELPLFPQE